MKCRYVIIYTNYGNMINKNCIHNKGVNNSK